MARSKRNAGDTCRLLIALTIIVAIIIILITPDSALAVGSIAALLAFLAALSGRSKYGDGGDRDDGGECRAGSASRRAGRAYASAGAPPPIPPCAPCDDPPINRGPPAWRSWVKRSDPGAVYESQAVSLTQGGREYRDGFRSRRCSRCTAAGPDTPGSGTCGCSAAEQEMIRYVGSTEDPDWDRLAAKAEAQGLSLSEGGGGPDGPGTYVRGAAFTIPGYRPGGVTASQLEGENFTVGGQRDSFTPLPGGHNPHAVFAAWGDTDVPFNDSSVAPAPYDRTRVLDVTPYGSKYPGAIQAASRDVDTPGAWFRGARDREESENYVIDGNPFDVSRLAAPQAAGACTDDEANDMEMDIDEQNANQVRSRNDETRVVAGTMNRRRWLDPYLREELDEEEYEWAPWWGKHEL